MTVSTTKLKPEKRIARLAVFRKYIRLLHLEMVVHGFVVDKIKPNSNHWRDKPASDAQKEWAPKLISRLSKAKDIPQLHRKMLIDVANVEVRWDGLSHGLVLDSLRRLMEDVVPALGI